MVRTHPPPPDIKIADVRPKYRMQRGRKVKWALVLVQTQDKGMYLRNGKYVADELRFNWNGQVIAIEA